MTSLVALLEKLGPQLPSYKVMQLHDKEVFGVSAHSHYVEPGNLFIASASLNQHSHIARAIEAGARAIVVNRPLRKCTLAQIITSSPDQWQAPLSSFFYGNPSKQLSLVGITGTKGKSTTAILTHYLLEQCDHASGLIGTIYWAIRNRTFPSQWTTPPLFLQQRMLCKMVDAQCRSAILEVSSHGLDQNRCENLTFDCALFTNFSQDHLDYHKTMESYFQAKARLFSSLHSTANAICNADDPMVSSIRPLCPASLLTYGIAQKAECMAYDIVQGENGLRGRVKYGGKTLPFFLPLLGIHNVYNMLAALLAASSLGYAFERLIPLLKQFPGIPGRLEKVLHPRGVTCYIDFAHTPASLEFALQAVLKNTAGKVWLVFGCGGNRDRGKRKQMGKVAAHYADSIILTADNPRDEDPHLICHDIAEGIPPSFSFTVEINRLSAIEMAIEEARKGDVILIAGKGHEKEQIFERGRSIPFHDAAVVRNLCQVCSR